MQVGRTAAEQSRRQVLLVNRELRRTGLKGIALPCMSDDPFCRPAPPWDAALKPVRVKELRPGSWSRGRILHGSLCDTAFNLLGSLAVTAIEDDSGSVVRLMLRNTIQGAVSTSKLQGMYPEGAEVIIKEPCLVERVLNIPGRTLWVTNPAAFQVVSFFPRVQDCAKQLMDLGDEQFEQKNFEAAVDLYTRVLRLSEQKKAGVLSRRAEAHLKLGSYSRAVNDAEEAIHLDSDNGNTFAIRAQAFMMLRQYGAAAESYERAAELLQDFSLRSELELSKKLYEQSSAGNFLISAAALARSDEAFPDFVGPVEVCMSSEDKGRGLFTTAKVKAGDLLLVHNAVVPNPDSLSPPDFLTRCIAACLACPRTLAQVCSMYRLEVVPNMDIFRPNTSLDDRTLIQQQRGVGFDSAAIERMVIRATNTDNQVDGLWTLPRFINHSCLPNVSIGRVEDARFVYAARDLEAGSELLTSYLERNHIDLLRPWNSFRRSCECGSPDCPSCSSPDSFSCRCARCELERQLEVPFSKLCERLKAATNDSELVQLAVEVEQKLRVLNLENEEQAHWLRASFSEAYLCYFKGNARIEGMPAVEDFLEALHCTAPGSHAALRAMIDCSEWSFHHRSNSKKVLQLLQQACCSKYGDVVGRDMYPTGSVNASWLLFAAVVVAPLAAAMVELIR